VLAVTFESVPEYAAHYGPYFAAFEILSIAVFTVEYAARLWTAPEDPRYAKGAVRGRLRYALRPLMIVDFLAFAPAYFLPFLPFLDSRLLRLFRLLRLLKIVRYSPALTTLGHVISAERRALFGTLILLLSVMCVSAEAMHAIEGAVQPKFFGTLPDAMWWAIATLATVGYGDAVPVTVLGKIVAAITMILGLGLFALPVGIVATGFMQEIHRRDFVVSWGMLARVKLFEDFDIETMGDIVSALRSHLIAAGTKIIEAGEHAEAMYFVISGDVEEDHTGRGRRRFHPGDFFGETALLHAQPHEATVIARTRARLLALSAEDYAHLARKYPLLKQRIAEHAEKRA
jgi:voltage-gated potassium channel